MKTGEAVQIISTDDHKLSLNGDILQQILGAKELKDRNVVVISIAGSLRNGKSFLLNFFLKYLYAQYKTHNMSNWIGDRIEQGFSWRGGKKHHTIGIWMWSEIFTHDFANGEKVAIILMDTQGLFDNESTMNDCISIFAISMLLSSVQCYNLMRNVEECNLQHLQLFTQYAQLAMQESHETPFQKLLFLIRDWPFPCDNEFGYSPEFVDYHLAENDKQTPDMRELRQQIRKSIRDIGAFLMPDPGKHVVRGQDFNGEIEKIDEDFMKYVKELIPSICAPDKLIAKEIHGQPIRMTQFMKYLKSFVDIFGSDELPKPRAVLEATAEVFLSKLHEESFELYSSEMNGFLDDRKPLMEQSNPQRVLDDIREKSLSLFNKKGRFGGHEIISQFKSQLQADIECIYSNFVPIYLAELFDVYHKMYIDGLQDLRYNPKLAKAEISPQTKLENLKEMCLSEFNEKLIGNSEQISEQRSRLEESFQTLYDKFVSVYMDALYKDCYQMYENGMKILEVNPEAIVNQEDPQKIIDNMKEKALKKFDLMAVGDFERIAERKLELNESITRCYDDAVRNYRRNLYYDCILEASPRLTLQVTDPQSLLDTSRERSLAQFEKAAKFGNKEKFLEMKTKLEIEIQSAANKCVEEYLCLLHQDCFKSYETNMRSIFADENSFYAPEDLRENHSQARSNAYEQFHGKAIFRNEHHRYLKDKSRNELEKLITTELDALSNLNWERAEAASSWRGRIMATAGVVGTVVGVATTAVAVVATGPFTLPAFIAGSRVLATTAVLSGGLLNGITTGVGLGGAIANRIPWLNRQRIRQ